MNKRDKAMRPFVGKLQYEGKKEFYVGTVWMEAGAQDHEVRVALLALWKSIIPFDPPQSFALVSGAVYFTEDA